MQDGKSKTEQNTTKQTKKPEPNHKLKPPVFKPCKQNFLIPAALFSLSICPEIMGWILSTLVVAQQLIYSKLFC